MKNWPKSFLKIFLPIFLLTYLQMKHFLILLLALSFLACQQEDKQSKNEYKTLAIIPTPSKLLQREGVFIFNKDVKLSADFSDLRQQELVAHAVEELKNIISHKLKVADVYRTDAKAKTISFILNREENNGESYEILVEDHGIKITSSSINGLFYGFQTLLQLIDQELNNDVIEIPAIRIQDQPAMLYRGVLVRDVSDELLNWENNLRQLASVKLNTILLDFSILEDFDSLKLTKYLALSNKYHIRLIPYFSAEADNAMTDFDQEKLSNFTMIATDEKTTHLLTKLASPGQIILSLTRDREAHLSTPGSTILSVDIDDLKNHTALEELLLLNSNDSAKDIGGTILMEPNFLSESNSYLGYLSVIAWSKINTKSLDNTISTIERFHN